MIQYHNLTFCFRASGRRAFSLVELLVAVVIVACLAMLAFTAFMGVQQKSQAARCVGQLRLIGSALMAYCADHDGQLISAAAIGDNYFWFDELNRYIGYPGYGENYAYPPVGSEGVGFPLPWQQCPAQKLRARQQVGYGWNHTNFGYKAWSTSFNSHSNIRQVSQPARTIIIGDSKDKTVNPGADFEYRYVGLEAGSNTAKLAARHAGKGNYLMLDGHVESFRPEELPPSNTLWKKK